MKLSLLALGLTACAAAPPPPPAPPTDAELACLHRYLGAVTECGAQTDGESRCRYDASVSYRVCSRVVMVER